MVLVPAGRRVVPAEPVEVDRGGSGARVREAVDELDRERRLARAVDAGQEHRRSAVDGRRFDRHRFDGVRDRERGRTGRLEPAEDVRGLVDRCALVVRLEVAPVVRRGMGVRGQPVTQRLEPRDLPRLHRRPRRRRRADVHERDDVREAERRGARCLRPVVVLGQPDDGLHRSLVGRPHPLAGRTDRRATRIGDAPGPGPATCRRRRLHVAQPRDERGPQQDRRAEAPRPGPIRVQHRPRMAGAEPARLVERLAERDVVDALRQDRLEVRGLGSPTLATQRAARQAERVGEVDVGAGAHAERSHRRHGGARPHRASTLTADHRSP